MFSQTVEYALRAIVHLAQHAPAAQTTDQIAARTRVPRPYLAKVLRGLARGGLVRTTRGIGGGIELLRTPEEISILDVVNSVEPIRRIETCPLGLPTHGRQLCPLHRRLDQALAQVEKAFGETNLADLLREPTTSIPLCDITPNAAAEGGIKNSVAKSHRAN